MSRSLSPQTCARIAGVLFLLSFVAGGFGEAYVPSVLIVPGDATATAARIMGSGSLFRLGFAGYLVEALCDVGLTWVLYLLLRPVHRDLALLSVCLRLISTAGFAMGEVLSFSATMILGGAHYLESFSPDQRNTLALLMLKLGTRSGEVFALSGVGFATSIFVTVLAPKYASGLFMAPVAIAGLALTFWMLVKGVDVPKWNEAAARGGVGSASL